MTYIKYCPKCGNIKTITYSSPENCKYCERLLIETKYTLEDYLNIEHNEANKTIEEEYIIDNPEFSEEAKQARLEKERHDRIYGHSSSSSSAVKCPYCKSTNVSKISTAGRAVSVGLFGLASGKIGKQWHCNKCKSDF